VAILLCVLLDLFCCPPVPILNIFPPAAACGAGAPKLGWADPKLAVCAPKAGAGLAGAPNGFAGGAAVGAAAPKLKTPEAV